MNRSAKNSAFRKMGSISNEPQFKKAIENLESAFVIFSPAKNNSANIADFIFRYANRAAAGIFYLPPEQLTGKYLLEVLPFLRNTELFQAFCDAAVTHASKTIFSVNLKGNIEGREIQNLYDVSISAYDDEIAAIWQKVNIDSFVTETAPAGSKKEEEYHKVGIDELRSNEEFFRLVAEHSFILISASKADGSYIYTNKAVQNYYGLSKEETLKINPAKIIHPDDINRVTDYVEKGINSGSVELRLRNKNGGYSWFEVFIYPIVTGKGPYIIAMGIVIDERKKAEEALLKYKEIVSTTPDGIAVIDTKYCYEIINDNYEKFSGMSRDQIIGHSVEEYLGTEVFNKVIKDRLDRCLSGETVQYEEWFEYPAKGMRFMRIIYVPYRNTNGEVKGIVAISQDITALKHSKQELEKYAEKLRGYGDRLEELVKQRTAELITEKESAESADRLKSAFLAAMSHELRTPLNSVIGFTGILLQGRPGPLNEEQRKQLGMVQNSARHLLSLINDILDLSKIEAGQLNLNFERFSLPEVINKVIEESETFALKKNLKLTVSIAPDVKEIMSDKLRVQQVLLNLVNNAIKFTESGSVSVECSRNKKNAEIKIIDTGMGIEKENMNDLFHPFVQIDTGLARKYDGSGLGLSISKQLTKMLNGNIRVQSEPGKGSVFIVILPLEN